jgi:hypothetical protein
VTGRGNRYILGKGGGEMKMARRRRRRLRKVNMIQKERKYRENTSAHFFNPPSFYTSPLYELHI